MTSNTDVLEVTVSGFVFVWDEKKWIPTTISATKNKETGSGTTGIVIGKSAETDKQLFKGKFADIFDTKPADYKPEEFVSSVAVVSQRRTEFEPYPEGSIGLYSSNAHTVEFAIGNEETTGTLWKFTTLHSDDKSRNDIHTFIYSAMFRQ